MNAQLARIVKNFLCTARKNFGLVLAIVIVFNAFGPIVGNMVAQSNVPSTVSNAVAPASVKANGNDCSFSGAIFTTDASGNPVNGNIYESKSDVYLNGGPKNKNGDTVPDGTYYYRVTTPDGKTNLYPEGYRTLVVANGVFPLTQLAPFDDTTNNGGEYKVWLSSTPDFKNACSKTDNFKVKPEKPAAQYDLSSAVDCTKGTVSLTTNVPGTFEWSFSKDGQVVNSGSKHVEGDDSATFTWTLSGYGRYTFSAWGKFTPDDSSLTAKETSTGDVTKVCGTKPKTCYTVSADCSVKNMCAENGVLDVTFSADDALETIVTDHHKLDATNADKSEHYPWSRPLIGNTVITWTGTFVEGWPGGETKNISGSVTKQCPIKVTISVEVTCAGVHVTGYTDVATKVHWVFQNEQGDVDVAAGAIDFWRGTALTSYGPHTVTGEASMTVDGKLYKDDDKKDNLICGNNSKLATEITCDGLHVTGYTEADTKVHWTFQNEQGDVDVKAGSIDFTAGTKLTTFGPHNLAGSASMTVGGQPFSSNATKENVICGNNSKINIEVSCKGAHVTGYTEADTKVHWTFQNEQGDVDVKAGNIDFTAGTALTTFGPHDLAGSASMTVGGQPFSSNATKENVICGYDSKINVSVDCKGLHISGKTDAATTIDWTFQNEKGSQPVSAGNFDFTVGTALTTYGPHNLAGSAKMVVGEKTFSDADSKNGLICGNNSSISVSVDCKGLNIVGYTEAATTIDWIFQNEKGSSPVVAGNFNFTVGTALTTFGPHNVSGSAKMVVGGQTFKSEDTENGLICGNNSKINIEVSCKGAHVTGYTEADTKVHWTFQNEQGDVDVKAGNIDFTVGTALTTYGPHNLAASVKMVVGGKTFTGEDTQNGLICGPQENSWIKIETDCNGSTISGYASSTTTVHWKLSGKGEGFVAVYKSFSFKVDSKLDTYGPHARTSEAHMTINGKVYLDQDNPTDLICGPKDEDKNWISVEISCDGLIIKGHTETDTKVHWTYQNEQGDVDVKAGDFSFTIDRKLDTYGPHNLAASASMTVNGKVYSDNDAKSNLICGKQPDTNIRIQLQEGYNAVSYDTSADAVFTKIGTITITRKNYAPSTITLDLFNGIDINNDGHLDTPTAGAVIINNQIRHHRIQQVEINGTKQQTWIFYDPGDVVTVMLINGETTTFTLGEQQYVKGYDSLITTGSSEYTIGSCAGSDAEGWNGLYIYKLSNKN